MAKVVSCNKLAAVDTNTVSWYVVAPTATILPKLVAARVSPGTLALCSHLSFFLRPPELWAVRFSSAKELIKFSSNSSLTRKIDDFVEKKREKKLGQPTSVIANSLFLTWH